jgi:cob(I)alamin adenosyltransferase
MKIYTRTGDQGHTGLWGGKRVSKDAVRIQTYGTVDECNAVIGLACALLTEQPGDVRLRDLLAQIQNELFVVGSDLASELSIETVPRVQQESVARVEGWIDDLEAELPALTQFILPGGHPVAAHLHLARTVCRRAERLAVRLQHQEEINGAVMLYLNRLSDFLFVAARYANHINDTPDVPWEKPL